MAYIGTEPVVGQYRVIDDISGGFNGSATVFNLQVGGSPVTAGSAQQLLVSVGGVVQAPGVDYTVSTNSITFTTAPANGLSFFAVLMGDTLNVGTPSDGTVTTAKIADSAVTTAKLAASALAGTSDITGVNTTGTVTSGTTSMTVASATGITSGMYVVGEGITPGTTVSNVVSTTVTLSANANTTLSSDPVTFYTASKLVTPAVVGGMLCRAWVNFNGTGTVAIRASYNVSSITDNGTGDYTVNFATAMPDADFSAVATESELASAAGAPVHVAFTASTYRFKTGTQNNSGGSLIATDYAYVTAAIFR